MPPCRLLFALPFAYGVGGGLIGMVVMLTGERQEALFYLVNTPLLLVLVMVYGLAAALLFTTPAHRTTWTLLLAIGVVLTVLNSVRYGQLHMVLPPLYLSLVAAVQLVRGGAVGEDRSTARARDAAQL